MPLDTRERHRPPHADPRRPRLRSCPRRSSSADTRRDRRRQPHCIGDVTGRVGGAQGPGRRWRRAQTTRRLPDRRQRQAAHPRSRQRALPFLRRALEGPVRGHALRRLGPAFAAGLLGQAKQGRASSTNAAGCDGKPAARRHHHTGHELPRTAGRGDARHHPRRLCGGRNSRGVLHRRSGHRGSGYRAVPAARPAGGRLVDRQRQARRRTCGPRLRRSADRAARSPASSDALGAQPVRPATLLDTFARRHRRPFGALRAAGVHACLRDTRSTGQSALPLRRSRRIAGSLHGRRRPADRTDDDRTQRLRDAR